jgi:phosphatidylglycerol lysyltransferase
MLRKASLVIYALALAGIVVWKAWEIQASYQSQGVPVTVQLTRGPFTLLDFPSKEPQTRAIIIFGSGDGGWSGFEEEIAYKFQAQGYEFIGINFDAYAETDYDLSILQADFDEIARTALQPYGDHPPPVIVGGWSMGAAQAIAIAGGPNPPRGLVGLLLVDPCSRGRFGLRLTDRTDLLPTGGGTFGVAQFAGTMRNLHVVQWHAAEHYYTNHREEFLQQLAASVPWILRSDRDGVTAAGSKP